MSWDQNFGLISIFIPTATDSCYLLPEEMSENLIKCWSVLIVIKFCGHITHPNTIRILYLLQIAFDSIRNWKSIIDLYCRNIYKFVLIYGADIDRLHGLPLFRSDLAGVIWHIILAVWRFRNKLLCEQIAYVVHDLR